MRIGRTLPPVASQLSLGDLGYGLVGIFFREYYLKKVSEEFKKFFNAKHVFFLSSGTAALSLILKALGSMSEKKEVVIPAYTCFTVPASVVKSGFDVALCDINPETLRLDEEKLAKAVTDNTLCVIPTHLFGIPCDLEKVRSICCEKEVFLVEDAAQAMGGRSDNRKLGTLGDVGFFSLGRGKNISCGSGGVVVTNSDQIAEALEALYSKLPKEGLRENLVKFLTVLFVWAFIKPNFYWLPAGIPFLGIGETKFLIEFPIFRLGGLSLGLLVNWEKKLEESNKAREDSSGEYKKGLKIKKDLHPFFLAGNVPFLRFPFLMETRKAKERVCRQSRKEGLGVSPMYPTVLDEIPELRGKLKPGIYPGARITADRLVTLPVHSLVTRADRTKIVGLVNRINSGS